MKESEGRWSVRGARMRTYEIKCKLCGPFGGVAEKCGAVGAP